MAESKTDARSQSMKKYSLRGLQNVDFLYEIWLGIPCFGLMKINLTSIRMNFIVSWRFYESSSYDKLINCDASFCLNWDLDLRFITL